MPIIKGIARKIILLAILIGTVASASAQIAGAIQVDIQQGDNLIANLLDDGADNSINRCLTNGVAVGSTFTEWDSVANKLLPLSTFNGVAWSTNYLLPPDGTGGVLHSPVTTNIFLLLNFTEGEFDSNTPPARAPGTYLLGYQFPVLASFKQIIGHDPTNGDTVITLNATNQLYSTNTFNNGAWSSGEAPSLNVAEAAYFRLAPPLVKTIPVFTNITVFGTSLTIQGTNGSLGGPYVLIASTNVTTPLNQWTPLLTNNFSIDGSFNLTTNIINPAIPQQFFMLLQ